MRISDWSSDVCSSDLMFQSSSVAAPPPPMAMAKAMDEVAVTAQRRAVQEDLGDLKLYRVPMRVNVNANGQKQVALLEKPAVPFRSEEHTSELQSLMRISYAVFCLTNKQQSSDSNTN